MLRNKIEIPVDFSLIPNACGIYRITNTASLESSIGASRHMHVRCRNHFLAMMGGYHHVAKMNESYAGSGPHLFRVEVLEECSRSDLAARELHWIETESPSFNTYSRTPGFTSSRRILTMTRFEVARRSNLLDPTDLSIIVGVSRQLISLWEHGRRIPSNIHLPKLAKAFKMSVPNLVKMLHENQRESRKQTVA